ncbi:MAG TPA: antibiotic biosynthesis monooxygenase [Xanthobacteraceae bacterium]|jgi:quinol monooxygenase YgiN|nr:antibiotic biosynthesis monooxygenase [Xanthobacteraceae bacterium]
MRLSFRLAFSVAFFAALLAPSARAEDDAVYLTSYVEVLPFEAPSAQSKATVTLEHYREASRKQAGNLRFDVLTELGRPDRLVILEAWRDAASFDAHDKADSTARYRQAIDTMQSVPPDIRNNAALFLDARPRDNRPGAIYVVTHIDVTGDHKDDGVALLRSMSADTIKDPGNLHYDVFQQKNRPNHFTVVEAWANRKAQADHAGAAHTRAFRQKLLPMAGALYDERLYVIVP